MNYYLTKIKKQQNTHIQNVKLPKYTVWKNGSFFHITLSSNGCIYHKQGFCTVCDYGSGAKLNVGDIVSIFDEIISNYSFNDIKEILVGSYGSLFDTKENDIVVIEELFKQLKKIPVRSFIFETHCNTINENIINLIEKYFMNTDKNISIEMGLESSNEYILKNCLNKELNLDKLKHKINLIKKHKFNVVLNVLVGIPFLEPNEVIDDAISTILWANEFGADFIVLFPVNIKPDTIIDIMFKNNIYQQPSLWYIFEILNKLPDNLLNKIGFSWYGERQLKGNSTYALPPFSCDICNNTLINSLEEFLIRDNNQEKRLIIKKVFDNMGCDCYNKINFSTPLLSLEERIKRQTLNMKKIWRIK